MGTDNLVFLENIEWFDETGKELVHRIPEKGSGEIKWGAQLTIRESQAGIFFYKGKAIEAFGAGRHRYSSAVPGSPGCHCATFPGRRTRNPAACRPG